MPAILKSTAHEMVVPEKGSSQRKQTTIACLLLVVAVLLTYNSITQNAFLYFDDNQYIFQNEHVREGLTAQTVQWAFTTFDAANWHPLTWLSHALDWQIFGANPGGHHYVNVLLHAACAVCLFLWLESATGSFWRSLMVAALFALHPINVESVAWAAERKNVLSMLFMLLSLGAYTRYAQGKARGNYLQALLFFACGLMAKPQIITLPFFFLLLDWWPLQRLGLRETEKDAATLSALLLEKIPFFFLSGLSALITMHAQSAGSAVRTIGEYSLSARFNNAVVSYVRYLENAFWPSRLAAMYPHPGNSLPLWEVAGCSILLLLITTTVLWGHKHRYFLVGWLWFLGGLFPMIGIVQVGEQGMADRYAYIPLIGIFVMVVWGFSDLAQQKHVSKAFIAVPAALVIIAMAVLTYRQIGHWRNGEALWGYTLEVTTRNYMAEDNLAMALAKQGKVQEAIIHFQAAEDLHEYPLGEMIKLAFYEQNFGFLKEAESQNNRILQRFSDPKARGVAYSNLGAIELQRGNRELARRNYETSLQYDPNNASACVGMALFEQRDGNLDMAANHLLHAMSIEATDVGLLILANVLERQGHDVEAVAAQEQAKHISPNLDAARKMADHLLSH